MSSARQFLSLAGQAAGAFFGGPIGAAVGGIVGGELGGVIDGPPEGPRLSDLSAPQIEYGGKIPRLYGGPKWFEVSPLWMSEKTEHSEVVGGKGGDSGVEQFSYTCNMLLRITESREGTPCEILAITGVEVDGELAWTNLADAPVESIVASGETELWSSMTLLTGSETQAPWSVMEAAVGADNAIAYRGYCTVGFENFLLAPNGMPRRIRIQLITVGSQGDGDVFLLLNGNGVVGSTTAVDTSSWEHDVTVLNLEQTAAAAVFGTTGFSNLALVGGQTSLSASSGVNPINVPWVPTSPMTLEGRVSLSTDPNVEVTFGEVTFNVGGGATMSCGIIDTVSPDTKAYFVILFGVAVYGDFVEPPDYPLPPGENHWELGYDGNPDSPTATLYINGDPVVSNTYFGSLPAITAITSARTLALGGTTVAAGVFTGDGVRFTRNHLRHSSAFEVPATEPTDDFPGPWTPGTVDLRDILEYEAQRCFPLQASDIDFSAADGIPVGCHITNGSAAEAMQPLLTRFWFDLFSSDKLYLVRRGGSVEQSIAFWWTGSPGFPGLVRSNDIEVPRKKAITYSNLLADGETDTRTGDRESAGSDVDTLSLNLNMIPSEAQGLADTATWDGRIAGHTATVRIGARQGLLLQPGSVITLTDHHGNTYRCLVRRIVWDRWTWECEVRLDDPSILTAVGIAVDLDQRALIVPTPPAATLYVLDIPMLRIEDNAPGEYVAVTCTGRWRGATLHKSSDDVTYTQVGEVSTRATAGDCDSVLPSFSGWGWDNSSTLTVTLDDGSGGGLSSATKTAIEANRALNLAAVGVHGRWELIQFATATLLTGSTYQLSGFLRNLFGTEWASGSHAADDSFVLLTPALGRIPGAVSDLGQTRYYKAVPSGRSIANVAPESIVCEEQCLLPYAPTDVWNDAGTIRWNRRSRMEGAIGLDPPLGEASERYDAELYDGATLEDSASGLTTPEWTPVDPSGLTVNVYQLSDLVGRGHVAEKEMT